MKKTVPVSIWAKDYMTSRPIAGAELIDVPTGEHWKTGPDGYAQADIEPGRTLTLRLDKPGYPPMQSASVTVPEKGLTGPDREITLQVPGMGLYRALIAAFGKPQPGMHHVVTTVSAAGKNLHDDFGESGVSVTLRSADGGIERNDGIYLGSFLGKTEWIVPILSVRVPFLKALAHHVTSHDGGAIFMNVPPGEYVLEAHKDGVAIQSAKMTVFPNSPAVINVSPPNGPKVTRPAPTPAPG